MGGEAVGKGRKEGKEEEGASSFATESFLNGPPGFLYHDDTTKESRKNSLTFLISNRISRLSAA